MWEYPNIDPIAISLGPINIHWYAISYLVGLGLAWWIGVIRNQKFGYGYSKDDLADLVFYCAIGIVLGGRLGYMLFYGRDAILADPLLILQIWKGGMSFHGGMLGVFAAMWLFAKHRSRSFFEVTDFIAVAVPLGLGSGRIGNFINTELPGRVTEVSWALKWPGESFGRHPSSLYQATLEGLVLFAVLWIYSSKPRPVMATSGMFLIGYGLLRIISEMFREPDNHIGFVLYDQVTTGQLLSTPMVLLGVFLVFYSYQKELPAKRKK